MGEWKVTTIDDVADVIGGGTPNTSNKIFWGGDIAWLTPRDLTNYNRVYISKGERSITKEGLKGSSARLLLKGTVLVTSRAPIGYVAIASNEICTNQGFKNLVPKKHISDSLFLYYWIKDNVSYLQANGTGTTLEEISGSVVKQLDISLPPLPEQKAIAEVLSSLDDKIDLLHRQNKTLEQMAETLFRQWFVEEADEGWEEGTISDLIELNPNRKLSKGIHAPYLEMASLSTSSFMPTDWYEREFSSGMRFVNGDTLIARITPCLENGKTAYITFLKDNEIGWGSTEYIVMRPKDPIHPFFAYTLARTKDFRDYAEGCMEGTSGRQRVNINHLMIYPILIPDKQAIENFNNFAESIEPELIRNANQTRTLEKLRDTLLPKLMSGEVRVKI